MQGFKFGLRVRAWGLEFMLRASGSGLRASSLGSRALGLGIIVPL